MQIFLFAALAISLLAVVFALQNIVPVRVTFLTVQLEGSLALVLFVALVAGALISFLASVPALVRGRRGTRDLRRRIESLETDLAQARLQGGSGRQPVPPPETDPRPKPSTPPHERDRAGSPLEPNR
jgi:uncharacterized integral membrane protein